MTIDQTLKQTFELFCKKEYPRKLFVSNKNNRSQWFFLQAGTIFGNTLHYEWNKGQVHLHIEAKNPDGIQDYLFRNLQSSEIEWSEWFGYKNHRCTLKNHPLSHEEVIDSFRKIIALVEPHLIQFDKNMENTEVSVDNSTTSTEASTLTTNEEKVILKNMLLGEVLRYPQNHNHNHLLSHPLRIPDYQRIYCWDYKNVIQLLESISQIKEGERYHLGSIILHQHTDENGNQYYDIVDGQQRLVTMSLLFLRLEQNIKLDLLDQSFESTEANLYIGYNKKLISSFVQQNGKELKVDQLMKQLSLSVIILNNCSLDLAYTFFSTQNARGKALTDYDLLKAHHLRYIHIEEQAQHLAQRWDTLLLQSDNDSSEKDLGRTLGIYLFRLRKWMRKKTWSNDEKFKVKKEFEAARILPEVPPFGEQFQFYESIQGGTHFFAYADHFIYQYRSFSVTPEFIEFQKYFQNETHWWYRDITEAFLFAYYLKFGTIYLAEALYCIEIIMADHRYSVGRTNLKKVLEHAMNSEIILMIDQATSPTFFLAEAMYKLKTLSIPDLNGIRQRYRNNQQQMQQAINSQMTIDSIKQSHYGK